jgi:hypothetical protein
MKRCQPGFAANFLILNNFTVLGVPYRSLHPLHVNARPLSPETCDLMVFAFWTTTGCRRPFDHILPISLLLLANTQISTDTSREIW